MKYLKLNKLSNCIVALLLSATIISCKDKIATVSDIDASQLPSEEMKNVKVLYTENGHLKNEIEAAIVESYQFADTPYIYFPEGIHIKSYTDSSSTTPNADLIADKAIYKQSPDFFEAFKNVVARNIPSNKTLKTDTLYWDSSIKDKSIYSHSYSLILPYPDTIPALQGFATDMQFEVVDILKPKQAKIHYKMSPNDSTQTPSKDTLITTK